MLEKHVSNLIAALEHPSTITEKQAEQIASLLRKYAELEEKRRQDNNDKQIQIQRLSEHILHLRNIKDIANELYWGVADEDEKKCWEDLGHLIETYDAKRVLESKQRQVKHEARKEASKQRKGQYVKE